MDALGYYNGKWGPLDEMTVPMNDRGCYFGDGVYDAAITYNGVIFSLDEHVDRFFNSARLLQIELSYTKEELKKILYEMLDKMGKGAVLVYWQATRGTGRRNHAFSAGQSNLWIMIKSYTVLDFSKKIKLVTTEDTRYLHCNIKTVNLIPNIIAAEKAEKAGCYEAVFHRGETVTECSRSNVHIIKNKTLITHPADNMILAGIARGHIIKACKKLGITVDEREFTLSELFDADEVLVSSTGSICISAETVDEKNVGGKAPELIADIQNEVIGDFCKATGYVLP